MVRVSFPDEVREFPQVFIRTEEEGVEVLEEGEIFLGVSSCTIETKDAWTLIPYQEIRRIEMMKTPSAE
jgi:hypothetical protein